MDLKSARDAFAAALTKFNTLLITTTIFTWISLMKMETIVDANRRLL